MARNHAADLLRKVAGTPIRVSAARGRSGAAPAEGTGRPARQARLADGAGEAHRMTLGRPPARQTRRFRHRGVEN